MPTSIRSWQGRFFRRVFSRVGILLALGMVLVCLLTWEITQEWLRDYTDSQLSHVARMAELAIGGDWPYPSAEALTGQCRRVEDKTGLRLTIIDPQGQVLSDSEKDAASMENHAARPEVIQALQGKLGHDRRLSASIGRPFVYVAAPMYYQGALVAVVRVATPAAEIHERELTLVKWVATGLAVALPLALCIAWFVSRTLAGPVQRVGNWAQRLATGDLETSVEVQGDDEVGQVAESLERMRVNLADRIRQVQQQREDLEVTLGNLEEGVIAVNEQGAVLMANAAARRLLAMEASPVGWPPTVGLGTGALTALWSEAVANGSRHLQREVLLDESGSRRNLDVHVIRVREGGTPIAWILCVRDITERVRSAEMKADFVANASHELRTPVASIRAAVETLRNDGLDEAMRAKFMASIDRNVDRLVNLTEDLMHLNRVESPTAELKVARFQLETLYASLRQSFTESARRKNATLTFTGGDQEIATDARWLELVLKNLIDNAIKFISDGGHVFVRAFARDANLIFEVQDDGCGIPPDDLERVFERFYQVDRSRGLGAGGTGLGLAIVKHAVHTLGGTVSINSQVDQGTTVTFNLPACRASSIK